MAPLSTSACRSGTVMIRKSQRASRASKKRLPSLRRAASCACETLEGSMSVVSPGLIRLAATTAAVFLSASAASAAHTPPPPRAQRAHRLPLQPPRVRAPGVRMARAQSVHSASLARVVAGDAAPQSRRGHGTSWHHGGAAPSRHAGCQDPFAERDLRRRVCALPSSAARRGGGPLASAA